MASGIDHQLMSGEGEGMGSVFPRFEEDPWRRLGNDDAKEGVLCLFQLVSLRLRVWTSVKPSASVTG